MKMALTVKQVTEEYGISRYTLMQMVASGRLKIRKANFKAYLIMRSDLEQAIKAS